MNKTQLLYEALELKYQAQIAEARATLAIYFESSVGIGEHPQHLEEIDKLMTQFADAQDKLDILYSLSYNDNKDLPF